MPVCRPCHQGLNTTNLQLLFPAFPNPVEQDLEPSNLLESLVRIRTHSPLLRLGPARFQLRFDHANAVFCSRSVHPLWSGHICHLYSNRIALHVRPNHESDLRHRTQPNEQPPRHTNLLRQTECLAHEPPKPLHYRHQELRQFHLEPSW